MRRGYAAFLFVITTVLGLAALYGFYSVALDMASSGAARFGLTSPKVVRLEAATPTPFEAQLTRPVEVEHYDAEETSTRVLVTFTAYKLIASDGKLAGDLSLNVPVSLKRAFEPQLSEIVECPEGTTDANTRPRLEEDYAEKNLLVSVQSETRSPSVKIPIPLEDFLASSISSDSETCEEKTGDIINRPTQVRVPTELSVLAGPAREYPSDYHQLSANVQITLPRGFTLRGATQEDVSGLGPQPTTLPHAIRLRSSQGMEGRTISLLRPEASLPLPRSIDEPRVAVTSVDRMASLPTSQVDVPGQDDVDLRLLVVRSWRTQGFIYAVACLPLVLLLALVSILVSSGRASNFTDITVNLAVATLAILPLRAVLVPSDLQGLTRIDYILMLQLLIVISMAFLLNGLQLWTSPSKDEPGESGSTAR